MLPDIQVQDEETGEFRQITRDEYNARLRKYKEIVGDAEDTAELNRYEKSMGL